MGNEHHFGLNLDGKEINFKLDEGKLKGAMEDARAALGIEAFKPKEDHELRNAAIAAGAGFAGGAGLTALGQIGLIKAAEPVMRPMMAIGFGMLGGGRMSADIMASRFTALECLTPKPILIGGAVAAGLAVGGYELYKHVFSHEK